MKKSIKIITLYYPLNYGAFLQAFALQTFLENKGYEISFYKVNSYIKLETMGHILRKDIRRTFINCIQFIKYKKSWRYLNINNDDISKAYVCIVGSDEIWNIKNKSFYHAIEYFGFNINNNRIISYAPSCNMTSKKDLEKYDSNINFNNFSLISVRDKKTKELVEAMSDKKTTIVLDPTMLIKDYSLIEQKINIKEKYILVYGYKFSNIEIKSIKEYSKKMGIKLYSLGIPQMWCDKQIIATPFEFLTYVKHSECVITETFHGTVFSILYNKEFVCYVNNKPKIKDLLEGMKLNNRDASNKNNLEELLNTKIDYESVNKLLEKERKKSIDWLIKAIEI